MKTELTEISPARNSQEAPDPEAKNVLFYNPIFPIMTAQVNLDLPVQKMANEFLQMATDINNYDGGFTTYQNKAPLDMLPGVVDLKQAIYGIANTFNKELKYEVNQEKCSIQMWVNVMRKDGWHGHHNHPNCVYSGCFYVQGDEEASPLIIENPSNMFRMHEPKPMRAEDMGPFTSPMMAIPVKVNSLLLWPAWLTHYVPKNPSNIPRISVSFNVDYLPLGA